MAEVKEGGGMICWSCYWGWPKSVKDIYERALADLDGDAWALEFGPAHLVWDDENWDGAEWCIAHFEEYADELSEHERKVVMRSLTELAALPMAIRDPCPENYDGQHPELFPPASNVKMVPAG